MPTSSSSPLAGKTIVLGVGGGIAAYKVADFASKLTQAGANVHAVLTEGATHFITPLTFQALTHHPAHTSIWVPEANGESGDKAGMPHIGLADAADVVVIAPATADLIARLAAGIADDLLTTLALATRAPLVIAPAMNPQMLAHPATRRNLATLGSWGYRFIDPETGHMACEHFGSGRLPETATLLARLAELLSPPQDLASLRVVVNAGPTREPLDPVRFISNNSSGKMGYALAAAAARRGADVTLVSGPVHLAPPAGVKVIRVTTTLEMRVATVAAFAASDVLIAAAAPADFRAEQIAPEKIKRGGAVGMDLHLVANPDIAAECGQGKRPGQLVIGFAAETGAGEAEAKRKLRDKNLDAIAFNDVTAPGAGFDVDTNRVTWITAGAQEAWPLLTKDEVAGRIWNKVGELRTV